MRVLLDEADYNDDDRLIYDGELFTGVAVETGPDGVVVGEAAYSHGVRDGADRSYGEDGSLRAEEIYEFGIIREAREWHGNGRLGYEMRADEFGKMVSEQRWDEDGNPID